MSSLASLVLKVDATSVGAATTSLNQLAAAGTNAQAATTNLTAASNQANSSILANQQAWFSNANAINSATGALTSASDAMSHLATGFKTAFFGASIAVGLVGLKNQVIALTESLIEAQIQADKLRNGLNFAVGRSSAAADLVFIKKSAQELGLSFGSASEQYIRLAVASRQTSLEGQKTKDIFTAIAKASTVMGLSADETTGALRSITQMISKGTVMSEELKGQLGERLPGALQIAARALNVTTKELSKMLELGQVMAEDFLPKFAAQLSKEVAPEVEAASHSLQASLNRLATAWTMFKQSAVSSGIGESLSKESTGLANYITVLYEAMDRARASGVNTAGQWAVGLGTAIARIPFDTVNVTANTFNKVINGLSLGFLNLSTNVNVLPQMFETASTQSDLLAGRLAAAESDLAALTARLERAPDNIYLKDTAHQAYLLVQQLRSAQQELSQMPNQDNYASGSRSRGASLERWRTEQENNEKEAKALIMKSAGWKKDTVAELQKIQSLFDAGALSYDSANKLATKTLKDNFKPEREHKAAAATAKYEADRLVNIKDATERETELRIRAADKRYSLEISALHKLETEKKALLESAHSNKLMSDAAYEAQYTALMQNSADKELDLIDRRKQEKVRLAREQFIDLQSTEDAFKITNSWKKDSKGESLLTPELMEKRLQAQIHANQKIAQTLESELEQLDASSEQIRSGTELRVKQVTDKQSGWRKGLTEDVDALLRAEQKLSEKRATDSSRADALRYADPATAAVLTAQWEAFDRITASTDKHTEALRTLEIEQASLNALMEQYGGLTDAEVAQYKTVAGRIDALRAGRQSILDTIPGATASAGQVAADKLLQDEGKRYTDTLTDAVYTGIVEGGAEGGKKLRSFLEQELVQRPFKMVISALIQPYAQGLANMVTGAVGQSAGGSMLGSAAGSAAGSMFGSAGAALGNFGAGMGVGFKTLLSEGFSAWGRQAAGMYAAGSTAGALGMIAGPLAAIAVGLKLLAGLDKSGTPHVGGSAGTGSFAGSTNSLFGWSEAQDKKGAEAAKGIATSITTTLSSLDKLSGGIGKFSVATGFLDDSSKDGAWGALIIKKLDGVAEKTLVDWNDTRESKWAPKEFGDGEQGVKDYNLALGKDVKSIIDSMDLPAWAQKIMDSVTGAEPSLETISQAVDAIIAMPEQILTGIGTSTQALSSIIMAGITEGSDTSALQAGQVFADTITYGIEQSFYGNFATQITSIISTGLVTPIVTAMTAGSSITEAMATLSIDSMIEQATAAAALLGKIVNNEDFKAALANINTGIAGAMSGLLGGVSTLPGVPTSINKDQQKAQADEAKTAADTAAKGVEDAAKKHADELLSLQKEYASMEIELLVTQGKAQEALSAQRKIEIAEMDEATIAQYDLNKALRQQIDSVKEYWSTLDSLSTKVLKGSALKDYQTTRIGQTLAESGGFSLDLMPQFKELAELANTASLSDFITSFAQLPEASSKAGVALLNAAGALWDIADAADQAWQSAKDAADKALMPPEAYAAQEFANASDAAARTLQSAGFATTLTLSDLSAALRAMPADTLKAQILSMAAAFDAAGQTVEATAIRLAGVALVGAKTDATEPFMVADQGGSPTGSGSSDSSDSSSKTNDEAWRSAYLDSLRAFGYAAQADAMAFEDATQGFDDLHKAMQRQIDASRALLDVQSKLTDLTDQYAQAQIELMRAQGNTSGAAALERENALKPFTDAINAATGRINANDTLSNTVVDPLKVTPNSATSTTSKTVVPGESAFTGVMYRDLISSTYDKLATDLNPATHSQLTAVELKNLFYAGNSDLANTFMTMVTESDSDDPTNQAIIEFKQQITALQEAYRTFANRGTIVESATTTSASTATATGYGITEGGILAQTINTALEGIAKSDTLAAVKQLTATLGSLKTYTDAYTASEVQLLQAKGDMIGAEQAQKAIDLSPVFEDMKAAKQALLTVTSEEQRTALETIITTDKLIEQQYDLNKAREKEIAGISAYKQATESLTNSLLSLGTLGKQDVKNLKVMSLMQGMVQNQSITQVDADAYTSYFNNMGAKELSQFILNFAIQTQNLSGEAKTAAGNILTAASALLDLDISLEQTLNDLTTQGKQLAAELKGAQGDTEGMNAALRDLAIEGFNAAEIAAYDYNESLRKQAAVLTERTNLQNQLDQVLENTDAIRARELQAIDETNKALQRRVWAEGDLKKAISDVAAAEDKVKGIQSTATSAYLSALDKVTAATKTIADLQQAAADKMWDMYKSLNSWITDQLTEKDSPPQASTLAAQQNFASILAEALSGDTTAMGDLGNAASKSIDAARESAKSTAEFQLARARILVGVNAAAELARSQSGTRVDPMDAMVAAQEALAAAQVELVEAQRVAIAINAPLVQSISDLIAQYADAQAELAQALADRAAAEAVLASIANNTLLTVEQLTTLKTSIVSSLVTNFSTLDTSVNGLLTFAEFSQGFTDTATIAQLQAIFRELDTNSDGQISNLELVAANTATTAANTGISNFWDMNQGNASLYRAWLDSMLIKTDSINNYLVAYLNPIYTNTVSMSSYLSTIASNTSTMASRSASANFFDIDQGNTTLYRGWLDSMAIWTNSINYYLSTYLGGIYTNTWSLARSVQSDAGLYVKFFREPNVMYAKGGVFTNSIVSSPTQFNIGTMGEAGPEAIMPLHRDASGSLGIMARLQSPQFNNEALVAEIRALRQEVAELRASNTRENIAIASHTANTASSTRALERDGVQVWTDPAEPIKTEAT